MAVTNFAASMPGQSFCFHISRVLTGSVANLVQFVMPRACTVRYVDACARAITGTADATIMVEDDGTDILSSVITLVAGTNTEGTVSTASVAKDSVMTVDFLIANATDVTDIDVQIYVTWESA